MKQTFSAMLSLLILIFAFAGAAGAETTSGKMYKAVNKNLAEANYDYDKGSLVLRHVKTVQLDQPVEGIHTLKMAIAHYNTVRDGIFFKTHNEPVYYSPEKDQVLSVTIAGKIPATQDFKDKYEAEIGETTHVATVLILLFLILLIPAVLAYVFVKRKHSVLDYKLENGLFEGVGNNKFS
ncbi:MAG TPA: hypothetical protein VFK44_00645 [Bacillales bacterium]|nr:hypothetical protein [Bacillales bacterium]